MADLGGIPEGCPIPDGVADVGKIVVCPEGNLFARLDQPTQNGVPLAEREHRLWLAGVELFISDGMPAWVLEGWATILAATAKTLHEQAAIRREQGL